MQYSEKSALGKRRKKQDQTLEQFSKAHDRNATKLQERKIETRTKILHFFRGQSQILIHNYKYIPKMKDKEIEFNSFLFFLSNNINNYHANYLIDFIKHKIHFPSIIR
jgi:phage/plasmid primase-like uncharacterized protein